MNTAGSDNVEPSRPPGVSAVRAVVRGRVQGVGFRYTAQRQARRLRLTGWVRNNPDGTVETVFEGSRDGVDGFLDWLHEGPPGAAVRSVDSHRIRPTGTYRSFTIEL